MLLHLDRERRDGGELHWCKGGRGIGTDCFKQYQRYSMMLLGLDILSLKAVMYYVYTPGTLGLGCIIYNV